MVSDQLKNISSLGTIDDVSDLKDIKNVKGDEPFLKITVTGMAGR